MRAMLLKESPETIVSIFMISNASLELYFNLKELNQALKVVQQVEQFVPKDCKPCKSDKVTFLFWQGRVHIYFHRFLDAYRSLSSAFLLCSTQYISNKRTILKYLIISGMVVGSLPSNELLHKYNLQEQFGSLIYSFIKGDLKAFKNELHRQKSWFYHLNCYSIMLHRTTLLLYRNVFARMS
jgi:hypothetical protein